MSFFSRELSCTAAGAYIKLIMSVRDNNFWNEVEFLKCQITSLNLLLAIYRSGVLMKIHLNLSRPVSNEIKIAPMF